MKKSKKKFDIRLPYVLIFVLFLIVMGGGVFGYQQYTKLQNENKRLSNPQEAAKSDTERIKNEVSAIFEVPSDEEPTIASVADVSKLSKQAFFANAKNGDRVLMYQKAKKAILYRPDNKKIIEVAPINIGDGKAKATDTPPAVIAPTETTPVDPNVTEQPAFGQ